MPSPCFLLALRGDGTEGRGVLRFLFIASRARGFRAIMLCACFLGGARFISKSFFVLNFAGKE